MVGMDNAGYQLDFNFSFLGTTKGHAIQLGGDRWLAYQFDSAVALVGSAIENASQEMEKHGDDKNAKWRPKYTMQQLLDPDFRLPLNDDERPSRRERETDDRTFFSGLSGFSVEEIG